MPITSAIDFYDLVISGDEIQPSDINELLKKA